MRWVRYVIAAAAALGLIVTSATPAGAVPSPRSDEWWFPPWAVSDIWQTTRGAGVTVAVLDSGVNAKLPELTGAVLSGSDSTGGSTDGRTDFDSEKDGHGTSMSALIAGQGGGSTGFVGLAPDAKILPVRTTHAGKRLDFAESLSKGIRYAAGRGAKVINISLGDDARAFPGHCPPKVQEAIAFAISRDAVIVTPSGDSGDTTNFPEYPAACAGVVAVGATDKQSQPWKGTQRQDYVTLAAPGLQIGWVGRSGDYYPRGWGTSQATALTSAGIALIRAANPEMPAREVVQRILATALDTATPGPDTSTGYGIFRIGRAMSKNEYPVAANAPNPVFERFDKWQAARTGAAVPGSSSSPSPAGSQRDKNAGSVLAVVLTGIFCAALIVGLGMVFRRGTARQARLHRERSGPDQDPMSSPPPPSNAPPASGTGPPQPPAGPAPGNGVPNDARPDFLPPDEPERRA